jgi:hypothetical protein
MPVRRNLILRQRAARGAFLRVLHYELGLADLQPW